MKSCADRLATAPRSPKPSNSAVGSENLEFIIFFYVPVVSRQTTIGGIVV
jgi:hypothetical protein